MPGQRPLLLFPAPIQQVRSRAWGGGPRYVFPSRGNQLTRFGPKFTRLADALIAKRATLRATNEGYEPEKVLVFQVAGSVDGFVKAVRRAGLEWLLDVRDEDFVAERLKSGDVYFQPFGNYIRDSAGTRGHFALLDRKEFPPIYEKNGIRVINMGKQPA